MTQRVSFVDLCNIGYMMPIFETESLRLLMVLTRWVRSQFKVLSTAICFVFPLRNVLAVFRLHQVMNLLCHSGFWQCGLTLSQSSYTRAIDEPGSMSWNWFVRNSFSC